MAKNNYIPSFKDVLKLSKEKDLFLGSGNPNASILFIGKEAAIDKNNSPQQYEKEYSKNLEDWETNCLLNKQFEDIDDWLTKPLPVFNSLYPYKGQKNKITRNNKNGGTSKTWHNYQKITDSIFFNGKESELINFHEFAFCSELNQETGSYSKDIPRSKRTNSIQKRKELFQTQFFKEFPIKIVAVGHYVRDFDVNLEDIFKMKFVEELSKEHSVGLYKEYINIHYDNLEKPNKLLIHTNQLSMVSNELVKTISFICKDFLNKKDTLTNYKYSKQIKKSALRFLTE